MRLIKSSLILMSLALSVLAFNSHAAEMADQKIVLQVSSPETQTLALNVAGNILKHYGPDQVKVEIVAFGPGIGLMIANKKNKNLDRITSLAGSGVTFSACGNTLKKVTKKNNGKAPKLHAKVGVVPAGVVRIIELEDNGYKLIKP